MCKLLLFAGTREGRELAEFCGSRGISAQVCVATEYGEQLLPKGQGLKISHQRLTKQEMEGLMEELQGPLVIDATHPYAAAVTENIQAACQKTGCQYLRLVREETAVRDEDVVWVDSTRSAVDYLEGQEGRILAVTGSKELAEYTRLTNYRERVFARVLSLASVAASCRELGFEGKNLICMQGPFSRELNAAMIRQLGTRFLVTKESGSTGGFLEKYQAARDTGSVLVVIGRPRREEGLSLSQCKEFLARRFCVPEEGGAEPGQSRDAAGGKSVAAGKEKAPVPGREKAVDLGEERPAAGWPAISLVGIGMGDSGTMTREAWQAIREAQLIVGAERMVKAVAFPDQERAFAYEPRKIARIIREHPGCRRVAVVLSGDVGFYSGARKLLEALPEDTRLICGISSPVYFCSRLKIAWEDVTMASLHGRAQNLIGKIRTHRKVFALVGTEGGVGELCQKLLDYGLSQVRVHVGQRLSYADEQISSGTPADFAGRLTDKLSVVLVENPQARQNPVTHGIPDEAFLREKVPMTKEEVRDISLSKLRLTRQAVIYDVGAGTGSVSIEMALQAEEGTVYAVEKKPEAVELLKKNKKKFAADNLEIIEGLAPEALRGLPAPSHVFVGGSSGNLRAILQLALNKNPRVRIVVNAIALETVAEAVVCLKELPVTDTDIVQVSVARARKLGSYQMMMGQNPVYVLSCSGAGDQEPENTKKDGGESP